MIRRHLARPAVVAVALGAVTPNPFADPAPVPRSDPGRNDVHVVDTRRAIADDAVPPGVKLQASNNNLDVVRHEGRVYLAFRTAPSHFASERTVVYVVSSDDEKTWRKEAEFRVGSDLREPRLLSYDGKLFLYVSVLGKNTFAFEPNGVKVARLENGAWTGLEPLELPGRVVWRVRFVKGVPTMVAYSGGEHLYRFDGVPMSVELLSSKDGLRWAPLDPAHPSVSVGGGTEADFALDDEGTLHAVIRNEAGDETGWGSKVCRAPKGDLASWSCASDPRKFDSPLLFTQNGEVFLVGRRNATSDGAYDRHLPFGNHTVKTLWNQAQYIWTGKRCSLWRVDTSGAHDRVAYVTDLPSRGDTCFASTIEGANPNERVVYDYSSKLEGPDLVWNAAQRGNTFLYRHVVEFTRRGS